ncbi:hypothetical protein F4803DRAFT_576286 [Xylaria telfairii]|nr:hypothetical protein F4803DRAFT_576286 [Xylaria telfairii]
MPPKTQDGELTDKEKAVLANAWKCFEAEPKIDYAKLAGIGGYSNINSVRNIVRGAKLKLKAKGEDDANGNGEGSAASSPMAPPAKKRATATPKGKKRAVEEANGDEDEIATPTPKKTKKTPAKTPAKTAIKKGKAVKAVKEDEEDEEELKVEGSDDGEI